MDVPGVLTMYLTFSESLPRSSFSLSPFTDEEMMLREAQGPDGRDWDSSTATQGLSGAALLQRD